MNFSKEKKWIRIGEEKISTYPTFILDNKSQQVYFFTKFNMIFKINAIHLHVWIKNYSIIKLTTGMLKISMDKIKRQWILINLIISLIQSYVFIVNMFSEVRNISKFIIINLTQHCLCASNQLHSLDIWKKINFPMRLYWKLNENRNV